MPGYVSGDTGSFREGFEGRGSSRGWAEVSRWLPGKGGVALC